MRHTGLLGTFPSVRRATAGALGAFLALGASGLTASASAAPPPRTAVIVQLTPGSDAAAESRQAAAHGGTVSFVYENAFRGFAGEFTEQAIAGLQHNPHVRLVEPDGVATVSDIQNGPVWGLDRIDEHALPVDGLYDYPTTAGSGVTAYVIDTGIAPHPEFGSRLKSGTSTLKGQKTTTDCNGHGTHVAGTIAGTTYGVAKKATLVPVRVLDCRGSGAWSGVVAGIDWAVGNHQPGVPAVANMSLGGGISVSVDDAVNRLIADGVTVAVAAGNDNADAANYSPARVPAAITVAATDSGDTRASFSNYGSLVDLFAPGVGVKSAWLNGGTNTISGTSMATPHVTGAAALVLSRNGALAPGQVAGELTATATAGVVKNETGSPNRLLFVGPVDTTQ
jgi:subtilisin family serine protease